MYAGRYGQLMKRKSEVILTTIFQLIVLTIFGQEQSLYNYANLNSTTISAEYLDDDKILETVDNNSGWTGSWRENNWYYFEFNQDLIVPSIINNNTRLLTSLSDFNVT